MEKAIVIFPDNTQLSEFLTELPVPYAEVYSKHHSLIAPLNSEEINVACKYYNGVQISFHHYRKTFH